METGTSPPQQSSSPATLLTAPGRPPWFDLKLSAGGVGETLAAPARQHFPTARSDINASQAVEDRAVSPGGGAIWKPANAFLIGIAGGSASGKTSVSELIIKNLDVPWVVLLCMDSFYKVLSPEEKARAHRNDYDFDHPDAFDHDLLRETLENLKKGKNVKVPIYDFVTHSRLPNREKHVYGANVVIFEGIFGLYDERIRSLMDLKIFVDTDDDIRLARRLRRDIAERGRDMHGVITQYQRFVKPSFDQFIRPTMKHADIIVPRGSDNVAAIELISKHIARQLDERGYTLRSRLMRFAETEAVKDRKLPSANVIVLEQTPQLKFIHTMVRDREGTRDDFVFFADRLSRLVVERGLAELPFTAKSVTTPTGRIYQGLERSSTTNLCGVSIVRAGVPMERGLRKVCQDISIGKLLIQTDRRTLEPQLHYCKLPQDIGDRTVLLLDATLATGAAAIMAIRVLLEHGVQEDRILFLTLIAAPQGLYAITSAFPQVKVITSEVDWDGLNEHYWIVPGVGNFGDRYFGTEE